MAFQLIATDDCPGDNCPALQRDPVVGDIYVQGYVLTAAQSADSSEAGGALPADEGRLRIPGAVFDRLVAQYLAQ